MNLVVGKARLLVVVVMAGQTGSRCGKGDEARWVNRTIPRSGAAGLDGGSLGAKRRTRNRRWRLLLPGD